MVVLVGTKKLDGARETGALAPGVERSYDHGSFVSDCASLGGRTSVGYD